MRKAPILYFLLVLLLLAGWFLTRTNNSQPTENNRFADKVSKLVYTKHGRCRMDCRQITEAEVREIILQGRINQQKSDPADKPCPTYAIEGYSSQDNQHIRVVVADCQSALKLVTCIDLDKDHRCSCY